jgi:hypothetical protein
MRREFIEARGFRVQKSEEFTLLGGEGRGVAVGEGIYDRSDGITEFVGEPGGEAANCGEFFLFEKLGARAGKLLEAVGERELLATKAIDEEPDNDGGDRIDEGDCAGFDVLIDFNAASVQAGILPEPEEIQKIREKHDGESPAKRVVERSLKHRDAHEDVILAVVAIGGGGGKGEDGVKEDGDSREVDGGRIRTASAVLNPEEKKEIGGKAKEKRAEKKGSDGSPKTGEEIIGTEERDNDDEVEDAEDALLLTEDFRVREAPVSKRISHWARTLEQDAASREYCTGITQG